MLLEVGKRYVARNGDVTGVLGSNEDERSSYTLKDFSNERTYTDDGRYAVSDLCHSFDLVSEYIEPSQVIVEQQATEPQGLLITQRSAWTVPSGTDKHEIRIGSLFILQKGRAQFEEGGIIVSIVDDASGEYVTIGNAESKHPVGFDPIEWPVIKEAIDFMVSHCRPNEEMK